MSTVRWWRAEHATLGEVSGVAMWRAETKAAGDEAEHQSEVNQPLGPALLGTTPSGVSWDAGWRANFACQPGSRGRLGYQTRTIAPPQAWLPGEADYRTRPKCPCQLRACSLPSDSIPGQNNRYIKKIMIETRLYSGSRFNLLIMIGRTRDRRAGLIPHLLTD
jgi:hypothetical protein